MINTIARFSVFALILLGQSPARAEDIDPCDLALVAVTRTDGGATIILRLRDPNGQADLRGGLTPAAYFELLIDRGATEARTDRYAVVKVPVRPALLPKFNDLLTAEVARVLIKLPLEHGFNVETRGDGRVLAITRRDELRFELNARNDATTAAVVFDRREDPVTITLHADHSIIEIDEVTLAGEYIAQLMIARLFPDSSEAIAAEFAGQRLVH